MIAINHPLVLRIDNDYDVLKSLIVDLPSLYIKLAKEIESKAKFKAELESEGDYDEYSTVYNSYNPVIESISEVPNQTRCYILAAIYAFFERNLRKIWKELKVIDYNKLSINTKNISDYCNIPLEDNEILFQELMFLGLIRNH